MWQMLMAVWQYVSWVLVDGDWLNDWATHVPVEYRDWLYALGHMIASHVVR